MGARRLQWYVERQPDPRAAPYVACLGVQHVSPAGAPYPHRVVPNGCAELSCQLGGGRVVVVGPRRIPRVGFLAPDTTIVGLRFGPGAASGILGVPATELVGVEIDLAEIWGVAAEELVARLDEAHSPAQASYLLERAVAERARGARPVDPLVAQATMHLRVHLSEPVQALSSVLYVSPRHLRRRLVASLGYGPKTLQRVLRFQAALALAGTSAFVQLGFGRLSRLLGYADQPHFSRECVAFTGLAPNRFFSELAATCGPSHDHTASYAEVRRGMFASARAA